MTTPAPDRLLEWADEVEATLPALAAFLRAEALATTSRRIALRATMLYRIRRVHYPEMNDTNAALSMEYRWNNLPDDSAHDDEIDAAFRVLVNHGIEPIKWRRIFDAISDPVPVSAPVREARLQGFRRS